MQSKKPNKHVLIRETCFNKNSQKEDKIHNKCKNLRGFRQQDFKLKRQEQWPLDGNMSSANIDRLVCVRERKEKGKRKMVSRKLLCTCFGQSNKDTMLPESILFCNENLSRFQRQAHPLNAKGKQ